MSFRRVQRVSHGSSSIAQQELHSKQQEIASSNAYAGANVTPVDVFQEVDCIIYRRVRPQVKIQ